MKRCEYTIWTDGSCSPNPGPGGWGAIVIHDGVETEMQGRDSDTTNNRMEMMAALVPLMGLPDRSTVQVFSDSMYLVKGASQWMHKWHRNGWATCKNPDLWQDVYRVCARLDVSWAWVKGHSGIAMNERADALASGGALDARHLADDLARSAEQHFRSIMHETP